MQTILLLLLLIGFCCSISSGSPHSFEKNIGDECFNYQKNITGVCRLLDDCLQEKKLRGITSDDDLRDICSFKSHVPVVCCPKKGKRICQRKCEEYSKSVEQKINIPILLPGRRKTIKETNCFIKPTFVSGGEDADSGEFPHMAIIGFGEGKEFAWGCGGSLISDQYILTAAHCMSKKSFSLHSYLNATKVRLGALKLNNNPHYIQEFEIIQRFKHENYIRNEKYHDIALMKLSRKVTVTKWVRPACLHTGEPLGNSNYTITGWGNLNHTSKELSKVLQKALVDLFSNEECNELYEGHLNSKMKNGIDDDRMICAAGRTIGRDTCPGDSGGPLQVKHPNATCMYSIVGVTSFGQYNCGIAGIPTIYTRVSHYIDWIESIVWS